MAVTSGTVNNVFGHTTPRGPAHDSSGKEIKTCYIGVSVTGTYDQSADSRQLLVTTAIANSLRDGKTIALLDAMFVAPGDESGTAIGAKTVAVSTTGLTFELTGADMSTEHAATALAMTSDIIFGITYTAA